MNPATDTKASQTPDPKAVPAEVKTAPAAAPVPVISKEEPKQAVSAPAPNKA